MPDGAFVVAIDGPSAAGKTTVGSMAAERLAATLVDTGVLYRVLTLAALEAGVEPEDAAGLATLASALDVQIRPASGSDGNSRRTFLAGRDVTHAIRSPAVDAAVSQVASHASVRAALLPAQRKAAQSSRVVVVGRDIGTVVFPGAEVKVYIDASAAERARRRAAQTGRAESLTLTREALDRRDVLDTSRAVAPLRPAMDAVVIQTDGLSVEDVVERIVALARARMAGNG